MRFTLKQKFWSLGQDFVIRDEDGDVAYKVSGKLLSLKDRFTLTDARGREVGRIEQRLMSLRPVYAVERDGEVIATIKKRMFTLLRDRYIIDVPGPDDLEAVGNIIDHEYTMKRGRSEVAVVSKRWLSITDAYGVEVAEGEDPLLPLAAAVVIDMVSHNKESQKP